MSTITINGISFDPTTPPPGLLALDLAAPDASNSNYILVQTAAPLGTGERARLEATGAQVHEYVSDNTYLCGYKPADLGAIRSLPFVTWADVYLEGFKVAPTLRAPVAIHGADLLMAAPGPTHSRTPHKVDVMLHGDVDPDSAALRTQLAAAAHVAPSAVVIGRHKARLTIAERYLGDLAAIDEVRQIEPVSEVKLFNNVARTILDAAVVINGMPFEGAGEVVAIADTGFDKGSTANTHPAFTGRVAKLYALGRPNPARTDDPEGHGTHVAGSVLGDGTSASMGGAIRGTAPAATLVLQSLIDSGGALSGLPSDLNDLFDAPYTTDGARVHSNSWGDVTPGLPYTQSSREIDEFIWNHPDLVVCFAAGNDGKDTNADGSIDPASVGSQAAAKNCITVGASESDRPNIELTYGKLGYPKPPIAPDRTANDDEGMAAFSSRGPTKEGRFKPDVVAPGTSILSTRSRAATKVPILFGTSSDAAYFFDTGTSMATPLVAGAVAVLRECLIKNGTPAPSAALLKAMVINGATELTGQYVPSEAGASPNNNSGFGRVDLAGSVIIPGPKPDAGFSDGGPLSQGQEDSTTITVGPAPQKAANKVKGVGLAGVSPFLKVTLVWTDPPGANLQNDLDLIVTTPDGQERHGNTGASAQFDRVNNVEQVVWNNIPAGKVKITVRAFRITTFPQPYAYVWRTG